MGQWQITVVDNWTMFNHNQKLVLHAERKKTSHKNIIFWLMQYVWCFLNIFYICMKKYSIICTFFLIHLQYSLYPDQAYSEYSEVYCINTGEVGIDGTTVPYRTCTTYTYIHSYRQFRVSFGVFSWVRGNLNGHSESMWNPT